MATKKNVSDEPLTPGGRLFLRPETYSVIYCSLGLKNPLNIECIKATIEDSLMIQHPRFCSLLVRDGHGKQRWRKTELDIDRHVIIVQDSSNNESFLDKDSIDVEKKVNDYIAELAVSTPLSTDRPLWEVHALMEERCLVFRIHHALGDGISLMSMLQASCRKAGGDPGAAPPALVSRAGGRRQGEEVYEWNWRRVLRMLLFGLEFLMRYLWVRDPKTVIAGGAGVELWPRKLATAKFLMEDMKAVKKAVANATINDVLSGVISCGLCRYLDHRTQNNALPNGSQITGLAMVNFRERPGLQVMPEMMKRNSGVQWGNKFGIVLLPVYYQKGGSDPLQQVKRAKELMDGVKQVLKSPFFCRVRDLAYTWIFGSKLASLINYRFLCNTTFTISNIVGPNEATAVGDNPVTFIRVNISSLPHALTMHMVSYAGRAEMQILVAKDIIPDPEFLAKCFEDALLEMKEAAAAAEAAIAREIF